MCQYIGVNIRPDITVRVQQIGPGNSPGRPHGLKSLNETIAHMQVASTTGLYYVPMNLATVRLIFVTDASFANARGLKIQLRYLLFMADTGRASIIHYSSFRCPHITRSVMASEGHTLVLGFYQAFSIRHLIQEILARDVELHAFVGSKTVFDIIAKNGQTSERRHKIDINAQGESYGNGELTKLGWIPGGMNAADARTKQLIGTSTPLWNLMTTNTKTLKTQG